MSKKAKNLTPVMRLELAECQAEYDETLRQYNEATRCGSQHQIAAAYDRLTATESALARAREDAALYQ